MAEPTAGAPELTVVVPAFNEQESILPMYERLVAALGPEVAGLEVLFVDDGSRDATWQRVSELAARDPRVRGIRFARNFGHQAALTAGVDAAAGRAVVIIDADLQDPPEVIPEMIARWREGYEVVYGQREVREGESAFKKATAAAFYRLLRRITNVEIPVDTGDFRLMGPRAVAAFRALPERNRFIRGLVSWIGFPQIAVRYRRHARHAGETKYPLRKMVRFALDGITSFSFLPLRLATWRGVAAVLPLHRGRDRAQGAGHQLAGLHLDDGRDPVPGRRPAGDDRGPRRVRGADLRRGQAAAALPGRRQHRRQIAGDAAAAAGVVTRSAKAGGSHPLLRPVPRPPPIAPGFLTGHGDDDGRCFLIACRGIIPPTRRRFEVSGAEAEAEAGH
jgi:dolichol-phosphate mannosyltransferase